MRTIILLIFIFIPFLCFSNNDTTSKIIEVPIIEVTDSNFYHLLDSVLILEKKCRYFHDSVCYTFYTKDTIYDNLPCYNFMFYGDENITYFLTIIIYDTIFGERYIGAIKYDNHYFFVDKRSYLSNNAFLCLTNENYVFYLEKEYDFCEDDRWAVRWFGYYDGDFYYIKSINSCLCEE